MKCLILFAKAIYQLKLRLYVVADKLLLFSAASFLTKTSRGQADAA